MALRRAVIMAEECRNINQLCSVMFEAKRCHRNCMISTSYEVTFLVRQKIQRMWMLLSTLHSVPVHSHPASQLSGLTSSCRVKPRLPSGLASPRLWWHQHVQSTQILIPNSKHLIPLHINLAWRVTHILLPSVMQHRAVAISRPRTRLRGVLFFFPWGEPFVSQITPWLLIWMG